MFPRSPRSSQPPANGGRRCRAEAARLLGREMAIFRVAIITSIHCASPPLPPPPHSPIPSVATATMLITARAT